jgi:hypothetical protein
MANATSERGTLALCCVVTLVLDQCNALHSMQIYIYSLWGMGSGKLGHLFFELKLGHISGTPSVRKYKMF